MVVLKKHVLVMSFLGQDGQPAPKLKEAAERMSEAELETAYSQVVEMMSQLYSQCHLVHADLSEYNILWWEKEAWFIDVSQAVEPIHPSGLDFLLRDCINVYNVSLASLHQSILPLTLASVFQQERFVRPGAPRVVQPGLGTGGDGWLRGRDPQSDQAISEDPGGEVGPGGEGGPGGGGGQLRVLLGGESRPDQNTRKRHPGSRPAQAGQVSPILLVLKVRQREKS